MNIRRCRNDLGEFRCFEVDNSKISRHGMFVVVSKIQGVEILTAPKYWHDELFCEFRLNGHVFNIIEPYGDNVTFDVNAPLPDLQELEIIANHFERSEPVTGGDFGWHAFKLLRHFVVGMVFLGVIVILRRLF